MHEDEQEVEAVLVLKKKLRLRTVTGQLFVGFITVYECERPYVIIINLSTEHDHTVRMDVHKEDLARELRAWLEGKEIRNPAVIVPKRIEDAVSKFIKFGKTPLQEDLIMWCMSRAELQWHPEAKLEFGGIVDPFGATAAAGGGGGGGEGGMTIDVGGGNHHRGHDDEFANVALKDTLPLSTSQAIRSSTYLGEGNRVAHAYTSHNVSNMNASLGGPHASSSPQMRTQGAGQSQKMFAGYNSQDRGTHTMTKELIGKSAALTMLRMSKSGGGVGSHNVKGREGARQVLNASQLTSDHWRLGADIEKARKDVEVAMDERRRAIEIAKTRQQQATERFRKIKQKMELEGGGGGWVKNATQELLTLAEIKQQIQEDTQRQKTKAHRAAQKVMWTLAPSGYVNRRGKAAPGAHLGPGPLPPQALYSMRDPLLDKTMQTYYWDIAGRRHVKHVGNHHDQWHSGGPGSLIELAMEEIRKAAKTAQTHKLDLKRVFAEFDTSGDGFLDIEEMAHAFLCLNVDLDADALIALFQHFDPNDSGSVHYSEFVWAFFNRRGLVRQFKRNTRGMSEAQIQNKFHQADTGGNGSLNPKEFKKLLKSFGIEMTASEQETLTQQFDVDGDGELNVDEFRSFIHSELAKLEGEGTGSGASSPPSPHLRSRPASAPHQRPAFDSASQRKIDEEGKYSPGSSPSHASSSPNNEAHHRGVPSRAATARPSTASRDSAAAGGGRGKEAHAPASRSSSAQYHSAHQESSLDPHFVKNALQAQSEVEARLGGRYY